MASPPFLSFRLFRENAALSPETIQVRISLLCTPTVRIPWLNSKPELKNEGWMFPDYSLRLRPAEVSRTVEGRDLQVEGGVYVLDEDPCRDTGWPSYRTREFSLEFLSPEAGAGEGGVLHFRTELKPGRPGEAGALRSTGVGASLYQKGEVYLVLAPGAGVISRQRFSPEYVTEVSLTRGIELDEALYYKEEVRSETRELEGILVRKESGTPVSGDEGYTLERLQTAVPGLQWIGYVKGSLSVLREGRRVRLMRFEDLPESANEERRESYRLTVVFREDEPVEVDYVFEPDGTSPTVVYYTFRNGRLLRYYHSAAAIGDRLHPPSETIPTAGAAPGLAGPALGDAESLRRAAGIIGNR